jgi:hypothetical protein
LTSATRMSIYLFAMIEHGKSHQEMKSHHV